MENKIPLRASSIALLLYCGLKLLGQAPSVKQDATNSSCSNIVALVGNANINCSSLTPAQAKLLQRIPAMLDKILANQLDPDLVMAKLDEIQKGVDQLIQKDTPRRLSENQKQIILRMLSQYKGQRIGTIVNHSKKENRDFLAAIVDALTTAGWIVFERGLHIAGPEPEGVIIEVPEADKPYVVAEALGAALQAAGVAKVRGGFQPTADPDNKYLGGKLKPGELLIDVGDKPE